MTTNLDTTFHLKCEYHTVPDNDTDLRTIDADAFAYVNDFVAFDNYFFYMLM